jgi:hypothetical protein
MTKLTDDDIRQIIAERFADDSCTPDDIAFARAIEDAIEDAVLERAASVCDETYVEPGDMQVENCHEAAAKIRAMKNKEE